MIIFKAISFRNFLSAGNIPIRIKLNEHDMTLIQGTNGSGKSLIMDALCFALYGRAYRSVNKPQLINSINQKQLETEVEFEIGKKNFRIVRGMKPNKFEIYENEVMINQDPNVKDYQKVLEQQILKMNYRAFTQVVVMGSSSYIPFMKLRPNERREFVEDLLDIRVFSVMNLLLKDRTKQTKEAIKEIESEIRLLREKVALQESFIKKQTKERTDSTDKIDKDIEELVSENKSIEASIDELNEKVNLLSVELQQFDGLSEELSETRIRHKSLTVAIEKHNKQKEFYQSIEECPTCHQSIHDDHKTNIVCSVDKHIEEIETELYELKTQLNKISRQNEEVETLNEEITSLNSKITLLNRTVIGNNASIRTKQQLKESIVDDTSSLDEEKVKLKAFAKEIVSKDKLKKASSEIQQYQSAAAVLLQDTGIKAKIIKQYIPIINKLVNKYLDSLDLFVGFNLNENFEEEVKSRHRDSFTYDSFSEGQKMRIDLALTFAWRDVARLKNSVNCNLIMCDEIFDASLDQTNMDLAMGLMRGLTSSNIFVISHKDGLIDKFNNVLQVSMKNNFTVIN